MTDRTALPLMRTWIGGKVFLYKALTLAFVVGLAAHAAGYVLARSDAGEPVGLLADLLSNLGIALWTGGVLVVFVQLLPEAERRSAVRRLALYEAMLRKRGRLPEDGGPRNEGSGQGRRD